MSIFKISGLCSDVTSNFKEQIELIKSENDNYITVEEINNKKISDYTQEEIKQEIIPLLKHNDIGISMCMSKIGYRRLDDDEGYQEDITELNTLLKNCELLKCRYITVYSPIYENEMDYDKVLERMRSLVSVVNKSNVILVLMHDENTYCKRADLELHLIEDIKNPNLKMGFSPSGYLQTNELPMAAFRLLKNEIAYIFINDLNSSGISVPVGMGEAKIHEILRMAHKNEYKGFVTIIPNMDDYLQRKKYYFKTKIPFVNLFVINSKKYKTYRKIDSKMGINKKDEISSKYLYQMQMRILKKMINRILN